MIITTTPPKVLSSSSTVETHSMTSKVVTIETINTPANLSPINFTSNKVYTFHNTQEQDKLTDFVNFEHSNAKVQLINKSRTGIGFTHSIINTTHKTNLTLFIAPTTVINEKITKGNALNVNPVYTNKVHNNHEKLQRLCTEFNVITEFDNIKKLEQTNPTTAKETKDSIKYDLIRSLLTLTCSYLDNKRFVIGTTPESFVKVYQLTQKLFDELLNIRTLVQEGKDCNDRLLPARKSAVLYTLSKITSTEFAIKLAEFLAIQTEQLNLNLIFDEFHQVFNNGNYRGQAIDNFFKTLTILINNPIALPITQTMLVSATDIIPLLKELDSTTKQHIANHWINPLDIEIIKYEFLDSEQEKVWDMTGYLHTDIINIDDDNRFRHHIAETGNNLTNFAKYGQHNDSEFDEKKVTKQYAKLIHERNLDNYQYSIAKLFTHNTKFKPLNNCLYEIYLNRIQNQLDIMLYQMAFLKTTLDQYGLFTTEQTWKNFSIDVNYFRTKYAPLISRIHATGDYSNSSVVDKTLNLINYAVKFKSYSKEKKSSETDTDLLQMYAYLSDCKFRLSLDFIFSLLPNADKVKDELLKLKTKHKLPITNSDGDFSYYINPEISGNEKVNILPNRIYSFYTEGVTAGRDFYLPKRDEKITNVHNLAIQLFIDEQNISVNTNAIHQLAGRLRDIKQDISRSIHIITLVNNQFVQKYHQDYAELTDDTSLIDMALERKLNPVSSVIKTINAITKELRKMEQPNAEKLMTTLEQSAIGKVFVSSVKTLHKTEPNNPIELVLYEKLQDDDPRLKEFHDDIKRFKNQYEITNNIKNHIQEFYKHVVNTNLKGYNISSHAINFENKGLDTELTENISYRLDVASLINNQIAVYENKVGDYVKDKLNSCELTLVENTETEISADSLTDELYFLFRDYYNDVNNTDFHKQSQHKVLTDILEQSEGVSDDLEYMNNKDPKGKQLIHSFKGDEGKVKGYFENVISGIEGMKKGTAISDNAFPNHTNTKGNQPYNTFSGVFLTHSDKVIKLLKQRINLKLKNLITKDSNAYHIVDSNYNELSLIALLKCAIVNSYTNAFMNGNPNLEIGIDIDNNTNIEFPDFRHCRKAIQELVNKVIGEKALNDKLLNELSYCLLPVFRQHKTQYKNLMNGKRSKLYVNANSKSLDKMNINPKRDLMLFNPMLDKVLNDFVNQHRTKLLTKYFTSTQFETNKLSQDENDTLLFAMIDSTLTLMYKYNVTYADCKRVVQLKQEYFNYEQIQRLMKDLKEGVDFNEGVDYEQLNTDTKDKSEYTLDDIEKDLLF